MKKFENVIAEYKAQTGKTGQMSEREMKLIEICFYHFTQNQAQLHQHSVVQAEGADEGAAFASSAVGKGVCDGCEDIAGFYLGTTCPTCSRPFRQVK